nr:MAG TPA: hypothetical protein [Caudoviricetes sp.]
MKLNKMLINQICRSKKRIKRIKRNQPLDKD